MTEDDDKSYHKNNKEDESMTEQASHYVADKAKKGTKGAVETAFDVGARLAEGMEQTFGTVKETTQKVKDTVLGNYDEGGDIGKDSHEKVDKHVEDLRKKAGGYDKRSY
ncbi:hypothetical protein BVRB_4g086870 [Beta vulgaris subsp. vulgaris]|nr:hypothetical protein BVRB_4g086870 [Beta vulgaris subsp. vulgaris]